MTSRPDPVASTLEETRAALLRRPPDGVTKREITVWWDRNVARIAREIHERIRPGEPLRATYAHLAAPKEGQRKVRPIKPEWMEAIGHARGMLDDAATYFEEAELRWAWHDWQQAGLEERQTDWALHELVGVPPHVAGLGDLTEDQRNDIAAFVVRLVGQMRGEWSVDSRFEGLPSAVDRMHVARWAAEAILCDALTSATRLGLVAVDADRAERFIRTHHSHLPTINRRGLLYTLGIQRGGRLVCVGTVNSPTGRWSQPHRVVELTRVASDGTSRGAASMLVSRVIDALPLVAPRGDVTEPPVLVTYSLDGEDAAVYRSLRDKGLRPVSAIKGRAPGGNRQDSDVSLARVGKLRWEAGPGAGKADWSLVAT